MKQYLDLLRHVFDNGVERNDRTGTGTFSVFGYQFRHDLSSGFPLLTTKKVFLKGIIHELLWMISGDTNIKYLTDNGVHIWDEWSDSDGALGPVYGAMWRSWPNSDGSSIDQIKAVVESIKNSPDSRRHIVTAWNPSVVKKQALPPCHCFFQFYVSSPNKWELIDDYGTFGLYDNGNDQETFPHEEIKKINAEMRNRLSCQLYQRSADVFLGVPFNIASYALLTMMVAQVCDLEPGDFVHTFGDVHIYKNHVDQVKLQLTREPLPLPKMIINKNINNIDDFKYEDFKIVDYKYHPPIKGKVSV